MALSPSPPLRYFNVGVLRVDAGRGADWADYTRQTNAAREKAGLDEHSMIYSVTSGDQHSCKNKTRETAAPHRPACAAIRFKRAIWPAW